MQNSLAKLHSNLTASTSSSVVFTVRYRVSNKQVGAVISSPQLTAVPKLHNHYKVFKIQSFVLVSLAIFNSAACDYKYKPFS